MFFVQTNHTRKELLFLMFKEINLRNHSSLHKLFYSLEQLEEISKMIESIKQIIEQNQYIHIPPFGQSKQLNLKSNNYAFFLDLNRKGHKRPKCTF